MANRGNNSNGNGGDFAGILMQEAEKGSQALRSYVRTTHPQNPVYRQVKESIEHTNLLIDNKIPALIIAELAAFAVMISPDVADFALFDARPAYDNLNHIANRNQQSLIDERGANSIVNLFVSKDSLIQAAVRKQQTIIKEKALGQLSGLLPAYITGKLDLQYEAYTAQAAEGGGERSDIGQLFVDYYQYVRPLISNKEDKKSTKKQQNKAGDSNDFNHLFKATQSLLATGAQFVLDKASREIIPIGNMSDKEINQLKRHETAEYLLDKNIRQPVLQEKAIELKNLKQVIERHLEELGFAIDGDDSNSKQLNRVAKEFTELINNAEEPSQKADFTRAFAHLLGHSGIFEVETGKAYSWHEVKQDIMNYLEERHLHTPLGDLVEISDEISEDELNHIHNIVVQQDNPMLLALFSLVLSSDEREKLSLDEPEVIMVRYSEKQLKDAYYTFLESVEQALKDHDSPLHDILPNEEEIKQELKAKNNDNSKQQDDPDKKDRNRELMHQAQQLPIKAKQIKFLRQSFVDITIDEHSAENVLGEFSHKWRKKITQEQQNKNLKDKSADSIKEDNSDMVNKVLDEQNPDEPKSHLDKYASEVANNTEASVKTL